MVQPIFIPADAPLALKLVVAAIVLVGLFFAIRGFIRNRRP
jgi:hypothetical protein